MKVNSDLDEKMTIAQLTAADPVNTAIFIDNKFNAFVKFLHGPDEPIGKIKHYFIRREYQGRCVTHFHCMIWIENAPIIGINSEEEISAFIQKYVTCQLPDKNDPLFELVNTVQRHHCNKYCKRTFKGKRSSADYCRFKFPRGERQKFVLNDVAKSIAARKTPNKIRLYDLPRTKDEVDINDYNPVLLSVARSNIDLQFISEKSCTVCQYICKYSTKAEKANIEIDFSKSAKSTTSTLWKLGLAGLQSREVGTIEAADTLLRHYLTKNDPKTIIKWVDTRYAKRRKVKTNQQMLCEAENLKTIFLADNVDDRYRNRSEEMEEMSLKYFIENYDNATPSDTRNRTDLIKLQSDLGFLKPRKHAALISHPIPNKIDKSEDYFQTFLLLFKPWQFRKDVLGDYKTHEESFNNECLSDFDLKKYEERIGCQFEAQKLMEEKIQEEEPIMEEIVPEHIHFSNELVDNLYKEFADVQLETSPFQDYIASFNSDQQRVFLKIISSLHTQYPSVLIASEVATLIQSVSKDPLFMFCSGVGGTGKSYLIKGLSSYVKQVFGSDVALMAPTGIAAANINGMTLHRLLQLPVQHGAVPSYVPLDDESLQKIHHLFKDVKLFILDEISMVSNLMIVYIHRRLCEIFSEPCSVLGGRNVIVFGDLLQLSPVKNGPCFSDLGKQEKDILKGMSFVNLWKAVQYEELLENVRQSHDNRFSKILQDVRAGFIKEVDEEWLVEKCRFKYAKHTKLEQKKEIAEFVYKQMVANRNYTILVPTTKMVTQLNQDVLKLIPGDSKSLSAIDSIVTRRSVASIQNNPYIKRAVKKLEDDPRQTAGLESILELKVGAKLMLRRNLDVRRGLCNGAIGSCSNIVFIQATEEKWRLC